VQASGLRAIVDARAKAREGIARIGLWGTEFFAPDFACRSHCVGMDDQPVVGAATEAEIGASGIAWGLEQSLESRSITSRSRRPMNCLAARSVQSPEREKCANVLFLAALVEGASSGRSQARRVFIQHLYNKSVFLSVYDAFVTIAFSGVRNAIRYCQK
jgi:hypothetical protein